MFPLFNLNVVFKKEAHKIPSITAHFVVKNEYFMITEFFGKYVFFKTVQGFLIKQNDKDLIRKCNFGKGSFVDILIDDVDLFM